MKQAIPNNFVERDVHKLRLRFPSPSAQAAPHVKRKIAFGVSMSELLPDGVSKNEFLTTIAGSKNTVADAIDACINGLLFAKEASEGTPVGWMVKLFDIHSLYQANKLKRNVYSYMAGNELATEGQKNELIRRLQSEPEFLEEYASVTLTIWNEAEHPMKAKIVGKLAYHHALGDISLKKHTSTN